MLTLAFSTLTLLTLATAQDGTFTAPFFTATYPTAVPSDVSSVVSAAQSAYSSVKSEVQSDVSAAGSAFSSVRSAAQSDISAAASAVSSVRSQVNSYQSSLLANPSVRSLIDQVTDVLPTGSYTNLGALETFAVNAPDAFLRAYGPAISTASFYSSLSALESSINSENDYLRTAVAAASASAATALTTLAPSTVAATTIAATTVSGSTVPATTVAATTIAGVTAAATGAAAPLATKAAMGVIGLAAGVVGIAMM